MTDKTSNLVKKILIIVEEEYQNHTFSVTDLFERINYGKDKIRDALYLELNITPFILIENIRIEKALFILRKKPVNIKVVFKKIGYSSARVFRNAFKKRIGFPPSKLKEKIKSEEELKLIADKLWNR